MPPPVNQEINVNINALVKRIQDVKEFVAVIKSLREQNGPVVIDEKISANAKASTVEVRQLASSIDNLNNSISQIDEKQPTRLSNAIKLLSSVVQGLAAAGQAVDFVKSWIPGLDSVKEKGSEAFGSVKEKAVAFFAVARSGGDGAIAGLRSAAGGLFASLRGVAAGAGEAVAGIGAVGLTAGIVTGGVVILVAAVLALVAGFAALVTGIGALTAGFISLATIGLIPVLKLGLEYNAQIEQSRLGIASIIASLGEFRDAAGKKIEGPEALTESLRLADDQVQKLKVDAINTIATFGEILPAFQSALGPGLSAGLNLDQIRKLTVQIVQAAGAIGLPAHQIAQEVRAILAGTINEDARLAKILGISNEMVKKWKDQGTLAEELNKKLARFSDAGILAANTLDGLTSNLQEAVNVFTGQATERSFERLKVRIAAILSQIFDFKKAGLNDSFASLASLVDSIFVRAIDIAADFIQQLVNGAKSVATFVQQNRQQIDEILGLVGEIVSLIAYVLIQLAGIAGRLLGNKSVLDLITNSLRFTKGLLELIGATILGFTDLFAAVGVYVSTQLNPLLTTTLAIVSGIANALGLVSKTVKPGDGQNVGAEVGGGAGLFRKKLDFSVPKVSAAGGKGGGKKAQQPPDVNDSAFALEKARIESLFNLQKDSLDRTLAAIKQSFDDRKLSIAAFYAEQERLQTAATDAEIRLINRLKIERQKQFVADTSKIRKEEKDPRVRDAKLAIEQNKLEKDLLELNEKRIKLERDRGEISERNNHDEAAATKELLTTFDQLVDEIEAFNGHTAKIEIGQIFARLNPILEDLKRNFGEASTEARLLSEYIDALVNKAQVKEVLSRIEIPQNELALERLRIQKELNARLITEKQAHEQINRLEEEYLQKQLVILRQALALEQTERGQLEIKIQIADLEAQLAEIQNEIDEKAQDINATLKGGTIDFLASLADGTRNFREAISDLADFIRRTFARLAAERLVDTLFEGVFGDEKGQGGIGGFFSKLFGGGKSKEPGVADNTIATQQNTDATNALTNAISGAAPDSTAAGTTPEKAGGGLIRKAIGFIKPAISAIGGLFGFGKKKENATESSQGPLADITGPTLGQTLPGATGLTGSSNTLIQATDNLAQAVQQNTLALQGNTGAIGGTENGQPATESGGAASAIGTGLSLVSTIFGALSQGDSGGSEGGGSQGFFGSLLGFAGGAGGGAAADVVPTHSGNLREAVDANTTATDKNTRAIQQNTQKQDSGSGGSSAGVAALFAGGFATGGDIPAQPGGHLAWIAEAGHDEMVVTTDPRHSVRTSALLGAFIRRTGILPNFSSLADGGFARSVTDSFEIPRLAAGGFVSSASPAALPGGDAGDRHLTIKQVNVYDPKHVHDAMRADGGDDVFWNFIHHNAGAIKRRLKI